MPTEMKEESSPMQEKIIAACDEIKKLLLNK